MNDITTETTNFVCTILRVTAFVTPKETTGTPNDSRSRRPVTPGLTMGATLTVNVEDVEKKQGSTEVCRVYMTRTTRRVVRPTTLWLRPVISSLDFSIPSTIQWTIWKRGTPFEDPVPLRKTVFGTTVPPTLLRPSYFGMRDRKDTSIRDNKIRWHNGVTGLNRRLERAPIKLSTPQLRKNIPCFWP